RRRTRASRLAVLVLFAWQVVGSAAAHPDYLAWFNGLAGRHPDRVLLDSNLDWGQDLYRLRDALAARGVASVSLAYLGVADPARPGGGPARRAGGGPRRGRCRPTIRRPGGSPSARWG